MFCITVFVVFFILHILKCIVFFLYIGKNKAFTKSQNEHQTDFHSVRNIHVSFGEKTEKVPKNGGKVPNQEQVEQETIQARRLVQPALLEGPLLPRDPRPSPHQPLRGSQHRGRPRIETAERQTRGTAADGEEGEAPLPGGFRRRVGPQEAGFGGNRGEQRGGPGSER